MADGALSRGRTVRRVASREEPGSARAVAPELMEARVQAIVSESGHPLCLVAGEGWSGAASRATSCVVEPAVGDVVLVSRGPRERVFVLAILEREEPGPATLSVGAGAGLRLAGDSVEIAGRDRVRIDAGHFDVDAEKATLQVRAVQLVGSAVGAVVDTLDVVGRRLQSVGEVIHQAAGSYLRISRTTDTVQAENLIQKADKVMMLDSAQTVLSARTDVRISGDRITMG